MKIPVLMTVDENYILQMRVTIWSLCKHADKDVELDITVLCSSDLNEFSKERILELERLFSYLSINFTAISETDFYKTTSKVPLQASLLFWDIF